MESSYEVILKSTTERKDLKAGKKVFWQTYLEDTRPTIEVTIKTKTLSGLPDPGTDVSIILKKQWPSHWPLKLLKLHLQRVLRNANV